MARTPSSTEIPKRRISLDQQRFIQAELGNMHRYDLKAEQKPLPLHLVRAQRAIRAHERENTRRSDGIRKRFDALVQKVKREMYFGSAHSALKALDNLKAWVRANG